MPPLTHPTDADPGFFRSPCQDDVKNTPYLNIKYWITLIYFVPIFLEISYGGVS